MLLLPRWKEKQSQQSCMSSESLRFGHITLSLPCGARKIVDSRRSRAARSRCVKSASSDEPPLTFFPLGETAKGSLANNHYQEQGLNH